MTFGREIDAGGSRELIERFIDAGGNFLDTVNVYSDGVSAEITEETIARSATMSSSRPRRDSRWVPGRTTRDCLASTSLRPATTASAGSEPTTSISTRCTAGTSSARSTRRCGPERPRHTGKGPLHRSLKLRRLATARKPSISATPLATRGSSRSSRVLTRRAQHRVRGGPVSLREGIGIIPWGRWGTGSCRVSTGRAGGRRRAHTSRPPEKVGRSRGSGGQPSNWAIIDVGEIASDTGKSTPRSR
jgi:hypothetical protein